MTKKGSKSKEKSEEGLTPEQREKLRGLAVKQLSQEDLYNLASPIMLKSYGEMAEHAGQLREDAFAKDEKNVAYDIINQMRIRGAAITTQTITDSAHKMIGEYIGMLKVSDVLSMIGYSGPNKYSEENDKYLSEISDKKEQSQIAGIFYQYQVNKAAQRVIEISKKGLLGGLEKILTPSEKEEKKAA